MDYDHEFIYYRWRKSWPRSNDRNPVFYLGSSAKLKFYFDQEVAVLQMNLSSTPQS
jgi:hypothetical protein